MDRRSLTGKLALVAGVVIATLALSSWLGAAALHAWGAHRLAAERADFEARWGHLEPIQPPLESIAEDNGARWLVAGGQALTTSPDDHRIVAELAGYPVRTWSPSDLADARRILDANRRPLALLLRSGSSPVFSLGPAGRHAVHDEIDFLAVAKALRLLTLETRIAWRDGRLDDSTEALNAVARAADGLLRTPIVLTWIYGSAAERWAAGAAAEIVTDPCTDAATIDVVRAALPVEQAVRRGTATLAAAVTEIAEERLAYLDGVNDPSLGWSLPFWISSHYLFEDLFVAEILDRWGRYIDIGQQPIAGWERATTDSILDRPTWQRGLSLTGSMVPNLFTGWARAQAAETELAQLAIAIELRLNAPAGLERDACDRRGDPSPTALTGGPVVCRYDADIGAIVLDVPQAEETLIRHMAPDSDAARFSPIVLPVGPRPESCGE